MTYSEHVLEELKVRNPYQLEFHQAVEEVMASVGGLLREAQGLPGGEGDGTADRAGSDHSVPGYVAG